MRVFRACNHERARTGNGLAKPAYWCGRQCVEIEIEKRKITDASKNLNAHACRREPRRCTKQR